MKDTHYVNQCFDLCSWLGVSSSPISLLSIHIPDHHNESTGGWMRPGGGWGHTSPWTPTASPLKGNHFASLRQGACFRRVSPDGGEAGPIRQTVSVWLLPLTKPSLEAELFVSDLSACFKLVCPITLLGWQRNHMDLTTFEEAKKRAGGRSCGPPRGHGLPWMSSCLLTLRRKGGVSPPPG